MQTVDFENVVSAIQSVGFPVAVAIYLLWKYDKRLLEINEAMRSMSQSLQALIKEVERK